MKKIVSFALAMVMILNLTLMNVNAAASTNQEKVDSFAKSLLLLNEDQRAGDKDELLKFIDMLSQLEDLDTFESTLKSSVNEVSDTTGRVDRIELFTQIAIEIAEDMQTLDLKIKQVESDLFDGLTITTLQNLYPNTYALIIDEDLEMVALSIKDSAKVFGILSSLAGPIEFLRTPYLVADKKYGSLQIDGAMAAVLTQRINLVLSTDIASVDDLVSATEVLITWYDAATKDDSKKVYKFLDDYGFIRVDKDFVGSDAADGELILDDDDIAEAFVVFDDLGGFDWAVPSIYSLYNRGILKGVGNNKYAPRGTTSRAQVVAMLVRLFGLESEVIAPYSDVKDTDWFYDEVSIAYGVGLIDDADGSKFKPNQAITRIEIVEMISRMLEIANVNYSDGNTEEILSIYNDDSEISKARKAAGFVTKYGIIKGRLKGDVVEFRPDAHASRAEVAVILQRLLLVLKPEEN